MTNQIEKLETQLTFLESDPTAQIEKKIDTLNELAWTLRYSFQERCLSLSKTAYDLAKPLEFTTDAYQNGHLTSLRNLGHFHAVIGNFDSSFSYSTEALSIFDNMVTLTNFQKQLKADVLSNMGKVSAFMGYYPDAIDYLFQAIDLAIESDYPWAHAQAFRHWSFVHARSGEHEEAIRTGQQAVKIMQKEQDIDGIVISLNNLAWAYGITGDHKNGLATALKAIELVHGLNIPYLESILFDTIGELYLKMGTMAQAQTFLEKAIMKARKSNYRYGEVGSLINLGKVYFQSRQVSALAFFQEALVIGEEIGAKLKISQCHLHISKFYEEEGQFNNALHHYQQYHLAQQELFNTQVDKKAKYLQVLHATEPVNKEIEIYQLKNVVKNVALKHEISERLRAEKQLEKYKVQLEELVQIRTLELTQTNEQLQQEILGRKQIETALRESEERHRHISGLISDYAYVYSINANDELVLAWVTGDSFFRLTGYSWHELESPYQIYHPEDEAKAQQHVHQTINGKTTVGEYRIITKSGSLRWVQVRRQPEWDEKQQRVTMMNCVAQDITERKQAEEQLVKNAATLKRRNHELQNFTHISSHDLQEPLRKIQIFSERLQTNHYSNFNEKGQHYLNRIHDAAARSRLLIQDLLIYAQLSDNTLSLTSVDLSNVVSLVLDDLSIKIEETAARIEVKGLPILEANQQMMYQLFLNLIMNALKFHSEHHSPIIEITGRRLADSSRYEIGVIDNGIGFDEKHAERIFTIFQRLHGQTEFAGTGIGLTICRRIVEKHHGQITVSSQKGEGTQFKLLLPLKQPQNGYE